MSDFAGLRRNGTIYVDKTAWFYRLAADLGRKFCFLSRPRRFGKSLMITALREIFKGNRDLFDGLAISKTDWQWEKWPVIHFEFADVASSSLEAFDRDFGPIVKKRLADATSQSRLATTSATPSTRSPLQTAAAVSWFLSMNTTRRSPMRLTI